MGMNERSTETGIVTIGISADGMCQRKMQDHDTDDDHLHDQFMLQRIDRSVDQLGAIVGVDDLHALGERGLQLLQLLFNPFDDLIRIFTVAHDDDAADDIALPVQVGHAPPDFRASFDPGDITKQNRSAQIVGL